MKRVHSLQELSLANDYLFNEVMCDPAVCQPFLEELLGIKIQRIERITSQMDIHHVHKAKGVRLDLFIIDDEGNAYNVEMQVANEDLPLRSRYYQSAIDTDISPPGAAYKQLKHSYVIFICTFDLFGRGRHLYSFQSRCDQEPDLILNDKAHRIFLNTKGTTGNVNADIREFLDYVENTTETVAERCSSELVKQAHEKVEAVRSSTESEVKFMTFTECLIEEYLEEGRQLGRKQGMAEGRSEGRTEGRKEIRLETAIKMLALNLDDETITSVTGFSKQELDDIKHSNLPPA